MMERYTVIAAMRNGGAVMLLDAFERQEDAEEAVEILCSRLRRNPSAS